MKPLLHPDLIEAMRLTRAGRLAEATSLIQRLLREKTAPTSTSGSHSAQSLRRAPVTVDVVADPAEPVALPASVQPTTTQRLGGFLANIRPIGETLSGWGGLAAREPSAPAPQLPKGARFLAARFRNAAGSRGYKLYVPSTYSGTPLPLMVMLHGCTQLVDDFAAGTSMNTLAEEFGCLVAYPAQEKAANGLKCWNWFQPGNQQRDCGEPSLIAGITRQIALDYAVDPRRIYVAGLSAGGAAAAVMGATYPDIYAAVGVHSGLPVGAAYDLPTALAAMGKGNSPSSRTTSATTELGARGLVPTIVFHGDKDTTVNPRNATHVIEQVKAASSAHLREEMHQGHVVGGHTYSRTCHLDGEDRAVLELWIIHGAGHAWSGGSAAGSYTDPRGPDASRQMMRFFLEHPHHAVPPGVIALAGR